MRLIAIALVSMLTVGAVFLLALLFSLPVMLAWNYVMPHTFHMPEIGWLQAFCLSFLAGVFFKSSSTSKS